VSLAPAGDVLAVTTWNVGYAGLGAGSDFVIDGGVHWFPPSRRAVRDNAGAIARWLAEHPSDVVFLQELASAGPPNYWVDLKRRVDQALTGEDALFYADLTSKVQVFPLAVHHGLGVYARHPLGAGELFRLPNDGDISSGLMVKNYAAVLARLASTTGRDWSLINFHLAAFDEGGRLRRRQLAHVFELARAEYAAGRCVVIGGDWNMRLAPTEFPNTTEAKHIAWLTSLEADAAPPGWRVVADPAVATVRTNYQAYAPGENYTAVIDGFAVSPNVDVRSVRADDLQFRNTDHHPVRGEFAQKEASDAPT
jgi:endonuclease/exonuclease/phosphatase family metal-dependent hydrolase